MRFGFQTQSLQLKQHMFVIQNITLIHSYKIYRLSKDIRYFCYFFISVLVKRKKKKNSSPNSTDEVLDIN